nr:MAG TPA: hypothetical protein [Caudoviricetes sp.]
MNLYYHQRPRNAIDNYRQKTRRNLICPSVPS